MKFVLIGPVYPYRGGIAHYTTMLYRALRDQGHKVLMVSFKRQYPQWLFPGQSDKDPSKQPLGVDDAQYWIDSLNPITWLTTFQRIYHYHPDIIVLQWWTTFWAPQWFVLGLLNRIFLQSRLVYICHNVLPHESWPWDSWLARLAWQWGTRFIVQSSEEERCLLDLMPTAHVDVVAHPVYDMFADQKMLQEEARQELGLPLDVPVLLFFGIVREYKGLKDLLNALPKIRTQLKEVILIVAGEFWENKTSYQMMIEELGIADSIILDDRYIPNEDVPFYFSAADVLVAPYHRATGSGAVQMANGFGVGVVTTFGCEAKTEMKKNIVTPPNDPEALAKAILHFFQEDRSIKSQDAPNNQDQLSWDFLADYLQGSHSTPSGVQKTDKDGQ